jgi:hypothetical protein
MTLPLRPKGIAVWLIDNTALTFKQIAEFCGMHVLEVQAIADAEIESNLHGIDPVAEKLLDWDEIRRCEKENTASLQIDPSLQQYLDIAKKKSARYIPVARRRDKPDAVAWLIKNCPEMQDAHIAKLIGSTKTTVEAVRNRRHWNSANLRPRDPVLLGLCTQTDLDKLMHLVRKPTDSSTSEPA